jgi:spore germination protein KC
VDHTRCYYAMSYITKCIVISLVLLFITGCKSFPIRSEIENLTLAQVVGVDKSEKEDMKTHQLTVACSEQSSSSVEQSGAQKSIVLTSEDKTLMVALKRMQTHYDKTIFLGHANYFIFGEDTLKDNFYKYFDFIERYYEIRLRSHIYVVKENSAYEIIEKSSKGELFIADRLEEMAQKGYAGPHVAMELDMIELERQLDKKFSAVAIPALVMTDREDETINQKKKIENDFDIYGYAIVKNFKLAGYIDYFCSRGYNFLKNHPGQTIIQIKDPSGSNVATQVANSKVEIKPQFTGDKLDYVSVKVLFVSGITEQQSRLDVSEQEILGSLAKKQSNIIKNEIVKVINTAQEMNADFLGIDDAIRMRKPVKWEKIKNNWHEMFPDVKFNVSVESVVRRTQDITKPSNYFKES